MPFWVEAGGFGVGVSVGFAGVLFGGGKTDGFVFSLLLFVLFGVGEGCGGVFTGAVVVPFGVGEGFAVVVGVGVGVG